MSCLAVILKVHSEVLRSAEQTVPSQQGQQSLSFLMWRLMVMFIWMNLKTHAKQPQIPKPGSGYSIQRTFASKDAQCGSY